MKYFVYVLKSNNEVSRNMWNWNHILPKVSPALHAKNQVWSLKKRKKDPFEKYGKEENFQIIATCSKCLKTKTVFCLHSCNSDDTYNEPNGSSYEFWMLSIQNLHIFHYFKFPLNDFSLNEKLTFLCHITTRISRGLHIIFSFLNPK